MKLKGGEEEVWDRFESGVAKCRELPGSTKAV